MNNVLVIVPVRAGSKGLPGKNIREFRGKALYLRAVEQGLQFSNRCIINTDIDEIISQSSCHPKGVELQVRPTHLGKDDTSITSVLVDAIERLKVKNTTIILLQATSPLRLPEDIKSTLDLYNEDRFPLVFSVTETNPAILKNGVLQNGEFTAVSKMDYLFQNRQKLPQTFKPNGAVYVFDAEWFLSNKGFSCPNAGAVVMPAERSLDVDSLKDFVEAERLFVELSS